MAPEMISDRVSYSELVIFNDFLNFFKRNLNDFPKYSGKAQLVSWGGYDENTHVFHRCRIINVHVSTIPKTYPKNLQKINPKWVKNQSKVYVGSHPKACSVFGAL